MNARCYFQSVFGVSINRAEIVIRVLQQSRGRRREGGRQEEVAKEQRGHDAFAELQQELRHSDRELEDGEHRQGIRVRQRRRVLRLSG